MENGCARAPRVDGMRFGWLTLAHSPSPEADQARHRRAADPGLPTRRTVGFDGVWLTEHNFTGEAVYCDPIPFASAVAARTTRVRIGFAVIQMALRHPIRLAVQLALLDNLSRGRIDVGVGRGSLYNEYEYVGYGLRSDDGPERSAEAIEVMTRAWTEAPFSFEGKYYQVRLPGSVRAPTSGRIPRSGAAWSRRARSPSAGGWACRS